MLKTITNILWAIAGLLIAGAIAFAVLWPTVGVGLQAGAVVDSAATQLAAPTNTPLPPAGVLLETVVSRARESEWISTTEMSITALVEVTQDNGAFLFVNIPDTTIRATVYAIVHAGYKGDKVSYDIKDNVLIIYLPPPTIVSWELDHQQTDKILEPFKLGPISIGSTREETLDYLTSLSKDKVIETACFEKVLEGANNTALSYYQRNFARGQEHMIQVVTVPADTCGLRETK